MHFGGRGGADPAQGLERRRARSSAQGHGPYTSLRSSPIAPWRASCEHALGLLKAEFGERFEHTIRGEDFLTLDGQQLGVEPLRRDFDLAIGNPPYFKMAPALALGGNAPNAYARFMEVAGGGADAVDAACETREVGVAVGGADAQA